MNEGFSRDSGTHSLPRGRRRAGSELPLLGCYGIYNMWVESLVAKAASQELALYVDFVNPILLPHPFSNSHLLPIPDSGAGPGPSMPR